VTIAARDPRFWLTSAADRVDLSATDCLRSWLDRGFWGLSERNYARDKIRAGDWIAFYASKTGVVAYARAVGPAEIRVPRDLWPDPTPPRKDVYRLALEAVTWLESPVSVGDVVPHLEVFAGKSERAVRTWAWLVNSTRLIPEGDFLRLTGR
jgi:hypothetical protein